MERYLTLLDEIRAIATTGLNFARNPYDKGHYERLLEIASKEYASLARIEPDAVLNQFKRDLGYVTCKVGVNGAVFSEGKILLERRADDGCWGIPGGWVDVHETPEQAIVREMHEETSLRAQPVALISVFSRKAGQFLLPHASCHLLYHCTIAGGELNLSHESLELGYFRLEDIDQWHRDHRQWAERAFESMSL